MRQTFAIISLLGLLLCITVPVFASAGENSPSEHEFALLQLINQARANPLEMAATFGIDPDQVLADLPDLQDILIDGLPFLNFNANLYAAASAHTKDMLANGYYSQESLDGRTYYDRIIENGYEPVATGESLGILGFVNFVGPDEAVNIIFENMFKDELSPLRTETRNILCPNLKEAGIAFGSGAMRGDSSLLNVYLLTSDFGTSSVESLIGEGETLLHLINQARAAPLKVAESLGMDPDWLLADLHELSDILTEGLPPVGFNADLYGAAASHTQDMLENGFFGHDSSDGRTYEDRMIEILYNEATTSETLGLYFAGAFMSPSDAVRRIFENIFLHELRPDNARKRNILNPDFDEAGIGFGFGGLDMDDLIMDAYVATCDFGVMGSGKEIQYLLGVVYTDFNGDSLYTPGEGDQGASVILEKWDYPELYHEVDNTVTGPTGGFSFSVVDGFYRITVQRFDGSEQCNTQRVSQENALIEFRADAGF